VAINASQLKAVRHIVVLMLAGRSFDHMLGFLYPGNVSPSGQPFEGLTGSEANRGPDGQPVTVFQIEPDTPNGYHLPGAEPGQGYQATNSQLYGSLTGPSSPGQPASCQGFVASYADALSLAGGAGFPVVSGIAGGDIMGCFTPEALPVLSALARGYAVCDHWFSSAPAHARSNRAFAWAATSQGHLDNKTETFSSPTIFGVLDAHGLTWKMYGYDAQPLTRGTFSETSAAADSRFGNFTDFQFDAATGTLPAFTFLEPSWGEAGNSQQPPGNVALGEQLIRDVYKALRTGPAWPSTLLVITYDQHGGLFDHVPPPWGAVPPDNNVGEFGFGFDRFGVRVPAVLVSPLIAPGTVYRAPDGAMPLEHTSILKTLEQRWNLPALTARDAAASSFGDVLTLAKPRTDDVLAGVTPPVAPTAALTSPQAAVASSAARRRRVPERPSAVSVPPGHPTNPSTKAKQRDMFLFVLAVLGAWLALEALLKSWVPGPLGAPLIAAIVLAALFVAIEKVPALQERVKRLRPPVLRNSGRWFVALAVSCLVLVGAGIGVAVLTHSSPSSSVQGTITWPLNRATNVKRAAPLHASGTIQNLQPGHQLLLFLNFANQNLYYGGDPSPPITMTTGKWSETIFVGGRRKPGQLFKLYLVDMGPQDRKIVDNQANPDWNSGFPAKILWGPGEQVLASVTFTTD